MESEPLPASIGSWPKRAGLAALMMVVATNVWIGGPLLALWIGARIQTHSGGSLTIRPLTALTVFASLAVITTLLALLLRTVAAAYDRASGIEPGTRKRASWLGGADERRNRPGDRPPFTMLEKILVVAVVSAAIAFEIWFFFFSTSPIDQRSGRSAVPVAGTIALRD